MCLHAPLPLQFSLVFIYLCSLLNIYSILMFKNHSFSSLAIIWLLASIWQTQMNMESFIRPLRPNEKFGTWKILPSQYFLSSRNFKHGCWRTCFLYDSLKLPLSFPTLSPWDSMKILERNQHAWFCTTLIKITLLSGEYISHTTCFPKNSKSMGLKIIPGSHYLYCTPTIKSALQPIPLGNRIPGSHFLVCILPNVMST